MQRTDQFRPVRCTQARNGMGRHGQTWTDMDRHGQIWADMGSLFQKDSQAKMSLVFLGYFTRVARLPATVLRRLVF